MYLLNALNAPPATRLVVQHIHVDARGPGGTHGIHEGWPPQLGEGGGGRRRGAAQRLRPRETSQTQISEPDENQNRNNGSKLRRQHKLKTKAYKREDELKKICDVR